MILFPPGLGKGIAGPFSSERWVASGNYWGLLPTQSGSTSNSQLRLPTAFDVRSVQFGVRFPRKGESTSGAGLASAAVSIRSLGCVGRLVPSLFFGGVILGILGHIRRRWFGATAAIAHTCPHCLRLDPPPPHAQTTSREDGSACIEGGL